MVPPKTPGYEGDSNVGNFSSYPALHAMVRNRYEETSYVHGSPVTRQLRQRGHILEKFSEGTLGEENVSGRLSQRNSQMGVRQLGV